MTTKGILRCIPLSFRSKRHRSLTIMETVLVILLCALVSATDASSVASSSAPTTAAAAATTAAAALRGGGSPFVAAAPLVVAAVCRDGVVIIAAHTAVEDEPLLYHTTTYSSESNDTETEDTTTAPWSTSDITTATPFLDLPMTCKGPFRIEPIDSFGTALVGAGWRADAQVLAARGRATAATEVARMGPPPAAFVSSSSSRYGRFLATELSLYMAHCVVSERVRALSCVGLLAAPGTCDTLAHLWLVDATGAYPVRAHCIGGDGGGGGGGQAVVPPPVVVAADKKTTATATAPGGAGSGLVSHRVNAALSKVDFTELDTSQGTQRLLRILGGQEAAGAKNGNKKETTEPPLLPAGTRLEVAVIDSNKRRMVRVLLSSLLRDMTAT